MTSMSTSYLTPEPFIGPKRAAEISQHTVEHLAQLRHRGIGPKFYKPSPRKVLYRESDILAWIERSAQTITGPDAA